MNSFFHVSYPFLPGIYLQLIINVFYFILKVLDCLTIYAAKIQENYTNSLSLANFVGCVVGFLNVFPYTPAEPPPCRRVIL